PMGDSDVGVEEEAAVRERVRRHVDHAHDGEVVLGLGLELGHGAGQLSSGQRPVRSKYSRARSSSSRSSLERMLSRYIQLSIHTISATIRRQTPAADSSEWVLARFE